MSYDEQKAQFTALIKETVASVCRSHMPFTSSFEIDGLIGITLDKQDVFLVKINECTTNLNPEQPRKSTRGVKRKAELKEELVCQVSLLPPEPTETCVQTLPITVKQEAMGAAEGEVLLDTTGIILETSEEVEEDPNAILQSMPPPNMRQQTKLLDPDKAAQRLSLARMHTAKHNQYMKELRKKVILTEEEYESLQAERRKCRERGRLFRERQRLKKQSGRSAQGHSGS